MNPAKHRHTSNQHKRHQKQNRGTKNLLHSTQPDIITIQETKLTQKAKTSQIPHYTTIRTENSNKECAHHTGQGRNNFHKQKHTQGHQHTELQLIKIHIGNTKHITVANTYLPPRDTTSPHYTTVYTDIAYCIRHVTNIPDSIFTGDVNAHSTLW